jgi:hypothetical protein
MDQRFSHFALLGRWGFSSRTRLEVSATQKHSGSALV